MSRTRVQSWALYAGVGLGATGLALGAASLFVSRSDARGLLVAAAAAYVLQIAAFASLLALRDNAQLFLTAWMAGILLRFAVLGLGAYALTGTTSLPRATTLIGYVTFVFLLLLLEPVFLRWDTRG